MYPTPHPVQDIPVEELAFSIRCGAFPVMLEREGRDRTRERSESATLSPQMSNHSGQSPASIDLSDASQNSSTTSSSSQSNTQSQSYSPAGYFSEFSGLQMGGGGPFPHLSKEMDWSMLANFDSPGMNGNLGHLSGMPDINILHTEMNGFFGEPE